ncbi:sensor histidine kinase [Frigoribacterium faeni]|uniref:histidine kinase n=1 Tax=Frigoribacterium faeni TaxID=145483 RepID=A0A7W3PHS6_9MICO|nr:HAMP domain-containing sensor histidine kinase [Frigoribacterium faeni]MBA8812171.1 two-component system OmpR family sensor kinase [Frigoribacterium faeni]BFF13200.1 HAMP domain-containing sensor histidine kinase [Microbacterium flavescens]GEK83731.1 two-component sensor histidine kinase [Frigoribacterium faeni]
MSDALPGRTRDRLRRLGRRLPGVAGPFTLRQRLILSIVALVVLLTIVIGAISVLVLRTSLMRQLDDELKGASDRATPLVNSQSSNARPNLSPDGDDLTGPRQSPGTFTAVVVDGQVMVAYRVADTGQIVTPALTDDLTTTVQSVTGTAQPETVSLGSALGTYRVESLAVSYQETTASGVTSTPAYLVVGLPTSSVDRTITVMVVTIVAVTVIGLAIAIAIAFAVVRSALRPLERMSDTALRVAELPLDRGEVALAERVDEQDTDTRTEVGRVGASLNRMLGHVAGALEARQQSENKVRQFVADASHELRTPLASVRGYAELTRRMNADLPEDVVYSMGRIESEAVRMTSLVEDLLLLARLDEGRDLVLADVDLTRIVLDAVNDAHVAGPSHDVDVVVPDEPVVVSGDGMRLHQIIANLLTNARTHTPEGSHVHVTLGVESGEAVVRVADDGPGIEPSVLPVLFERFARADSSRSRKAGSTGLGLAIVDAVVHAHGGTVGVDSSDRGATFTVRLPLGAPVPVGAPPAGAAHV